MIVCTHVLVKHNSTRPQTIPTPSNAEAKVFYQKMKADYLRYTAEVRIDDAKSKAADNARFAYQEATNVAEKELAATHSYRLGLAVNFSVFQYEVLSNEEEAIKVARSAFEGALHEIDNVAGDSYIVMGMLHGNLTYWSKQSMRKSIKKRSRRRYSCTATVFSQFSKAI